MDGYKDPEDFRRECENPDNLEAIEKAVRCCRKINKLDNTLESMVSENSDLLRQKLLSLKPPLPDHSSKAVCTDAVLLFLERYKKYTHRHTILYLRTRLKWNHSYLKLRGFKDSLLYYMHEYGGRTIQSTLRCAPWRDYIDCNPSLRDVDYLRYEVRSSGIFQELVMEMLEGQSDEIQDYFVYKFNPFNKHLTVVKDTRPTAQIPNKPFSLPHEVQCMIYEQLDLESCVQLRQVSHAWYSSYQNCEHILKPKLLERFPFMAESTWADSVLVFVSRLKTWTVVDKIDDIEIQQDDHKSPKVVASRELKIGEKLPANFEPIDSPYMDSIARMMTFERRGENLVFFDPWSLSVRMEDDAMVVEDGTVMYYGAEEPAIIVKYRGHEVSFPKMGDSYLKSDFIDPPTIKRHSIAFDTPEVGVVLPRDMLWFEDCYPVSPGTSTFELGHLTVFAKHHSLLSGYEFVDLLTHQKFRYGPACKAQPCTAYRGLVWWGIRDEDHKIKGLAPTFVDFQTGTIYYRKDWSTITLFHAWAPLRQYQCGNPDTSNRYLLYDFKEKQIVDLETKTVTHVHAPRDAILIPGYVNGRFSLRHVEWETVVHYAATQNVVIDKGGYNCSLYRI